MSEKLHNAPIYLALIQAQFNPVANMVKYIADIQDQLRQKGFTLFDQRLMQKILIGMTPEKPSAEPGFVTVSTWYFTKSDKTAGFVVSDKAITFHTTHYETRKEFIPVLMMGLEIVDKVIGLDHVSRLGVRYLDAVIPRGDDSVEQYIEPPLHGVSFTDQARLQTSYAESIFETDTGPVLPRGKLVQRLYRQTSLLGYPPDLDPFNLVPMSRFVLNKERDHTIIDTDHYVEGLMKLEFDTIQQQAFDLHTTAKKIFRAAVTKYAIGVWKDDITGQQS